MHDVSPIQDSWFFLYSDTEDEEKQKKESFRKNDKASMHTMNFG